MISNVSLYDLMQKITKDHAGSDLGEFREMLVSMLKTYSSELDVCSSAVDVMYNDIRHMSYEKKKLKVRGSIIQECPKAVLQKGRPLAESHTFLLNFLVRSGSRKLS